MQDVGEPCRLKVLDRHDAESGIWVDQEMTARVTDPLERKLMEQLKICYQTGKGNDYLVLVLFPKDTVATTKTLCDPEMRSTVQVYPDNPYKFACTSPGHDGSYEWLNHVCDDAGVQCKDRLNTTKNRHKVSTLYVTTTWNISEVLSEKLVHHVQFDKLCIRLCDDSFLDIVIH